VTNHAAASEDMTVHITDGDTIDVDVPVTVDADSTTGWATDPDVDVSNLPDGPDTFTITASYPFGGASAAVTRTVTITNI
jgi:hypothetical protein